MTEPLSKDHFVLLAVHYTSESSINTLKSLVSKQLDLFEPELILRILLTHLPESVNPSLYTSFVDEAVKGSFSKQYDDIPLDTGVVQELTDKQARKHVKHLDLLPLNHSSCPSSEDVTTQFIIHRAHQLNDSGLLSLVPALVDPFIERSKQLRVWFVSNVLPLLRFVFEYYPGNKSVPSLDTIEVASGDVGVRIWLCKNSEENSSQIEDMRVSSDEENDIQDNTIARDMRGLVGPWIYGENDRKRRRLNTKPRTGSIASATAEDMRSQIKHDTEQWHSHDAWENAFTWMVEESATRLPTVAEAIREWNGPPDIDLGGYEEMPHLEQETSIQMNVRYVQTMFASVYAATTDTAETILASHKTLVRIASLMNFDPPPDLTTSIELLPKIDDKKSNLADIPTSIFVPGALLRLNHPLTTPQPDKFSLLQMFVFSAYLLAELRHNLSVIHVAKLKIQRNEEEQMAVFQKILHLISSRSKKDEHQWTEVRESLLWLWGWGIKESEGNSTHGMGIFGKIERSSFEKEILKLLLSASCYPLIISTYIQGPKTTHQLASEDVEQVIIEVALHHYDNATNGNRTRGSVKKASEIILTLRQYFPKSTAFQRCEALLAATHALSFYSLTLQHGVPFQPVNIRVSSDPVSLIEKVLAQNPRSYTHLDDLISIGTNFVIAGLTLQKTEDGRMMEHSVGDLASEKHKVERRVIGMAIEAALDEDDFETAYSYVVNRLGTTSATIPSTTTSNQNEDDISWRAALAAGRHKSSTLASQSASTSMLTRPTLRRLEQRMELLSQALLLAPPSALPEVLNVWRKCEEEMTSLLAREAEEETAFDDRADKDLPGAFINTTQLIQPRREVGRAAQEEAPMGLFDVARGAAAAFSRSAFPLRAQIQEARSPTSPMHTRHLSAAGSEAESLKSEGSDDGNKSGRRRKRDMVADAVTGGLASGIGWVLGATPVNQQQR
jgi:hypothetical protein